MSAIRVRTLTEDQWPEWRALRLAALATDPDAFGSALAEWSGPGDVEVRWRARLAAVPCNLLADLDGAAAGMVSAALLGEGVAEVLSMWVAPPARGRGVGDALMNAALGWARAEGASQVILNVRSANQPAIGLYRRHGFDDAGPASPPGDPHPERRMALELA